MKIRVAVTTWTKMPGRMPINSDAYLSLEHVLMYYSHINVLFTYYSVSSSYKKNVACSFVNLWRKECELVYHSTLDRPVSPFLAAGAALGPQGENSFPVMT